MISNVYIVLKLMFSTACNSNRSVEIDTPRKNVQSKKRVAIKFLILSRLQCHCQSKYHNYYREFLSARDIVCCIANDLHTNTHRHRHTKHIKTSKSMFHVLHLWTRQVTNRKYIHNSPWSTHYTVPKIHCRKYNNSRFPQWIFGMNQMV